MEANPTTNTTIARATSLMIKISMGTVAASAYIPIIISESGLHVFDEMGSSNFKSILEMGSSYEFEISGNGSPLLAECGSSPGVVTEDTVLLFVSTVDTEFKSSDF